ncbi:MAG: amidohydrolase [Desulfobacterales bacterium]|jgi:amidohydrolase
MIAESRQEVVELRRDFHMYPELGLQEFRTADKIAAYLDECGLKVQRMNKTGVVGLLEGAGPGPTLLMRADIDALPIQEENDFPHRSVNEGVMHACGHDAHTAMLMVAAKLLSRVRDTIPGSIKFVFEPNEENVGALAMIEEGVLENPSVDACMGLHIWAPLPAGMVGVTEGPVMAGMEHFHLVVRGRGGHTATPQSAIDPILAAAAVIQGVQIIQTRETDALKEPTVIMFGKIEGGSASNVIPDAVTLSGTMRYLFEGSADSPDSPKRRFERVVSAICAAHRAEHDLSFLYGHPTLVNHPEMTEMLRSVASGEMSVPVSITSVVTLAGEDFSEFSTRVPGVFFFLGGGDPTWTHPYPHHHPRFDIDESALPIGLELHLRAALHFFQHAKGLPFMQKEVNRQASEPP